MLTIPNIIIVVAAACVMGALVLMGIREHLVMRSIEKDRKKNEAERAAKLERTHSSSQPAPAKGAQSSFGTSDAMMAAAVASSFDGGSSSGSCDGGGFSGGCDG